MRRITTFVSVILAAGVLMGAAPAFAASASITLKNTNVGTPTASNTFNKTFQNTCGVPSPTPKATFLPGDPAQVVVVACTPGTAGGLRYRTTTGKECTFNWSSIPRIPGPGYTFTATAQSTGSVSATCRSIAGARNLTTGNMSQTFEMQ